MLPGAEPWGAALPLSPMHIFSLSARRATLVSTLAAALALPTSPALAQTSVQTPVPNQTLPTSPAPATIRLSPDDLERGQYGPQSSFYFLPPGKTAEADYQKAGFFGGKLRPYLGNNAAALAELDHYQRQKTLYLVDKAVLVSAVGLYASQVFRDKDPVYFNSTQQVAAGAAVVSLVATLFINRHTNEYLKQAVDNYNTSPTRRTGWLRRPSGVELGAVSGQPVLALSWRL